MITNHPVKLTITSYPPTLEQIRVLPWVIVFALILITFVIPFPNQAFSEIKPSSTPQGSSAIGDVYNQARNICIEDARPIKGTQSLTRGVLLTEPNSQGPLISLGCKLRDCGPSASTDSRPIEMRFRLTGGVVADSLIIEFTNLPRAKEKDKDLIQVIAGNAVIGARAGIFRIPLGEQVILQISKELLDGGSFVSTKPTIKATLLLDESFVQKLQGGPELDYRQTHTWAATLEIDQLKGPIVVNEFKAIYEIRWCKTQKSLAGGINIKPDNLHRDQIRLLGADSKNRRVGFVNGRSPDRCLTYESVVGTDTLHVGNQVGNLLGITEECPSNEIVIFSPDRAMQIARPNKDWTDAGNEVRDIDLPKTPVQVPITIWILHKPEGKDLPSLKKEIQDQLELANQLFGPMNNCGIQFILSAKGFQDRIKPAKEKGLSDFSCLDQSDRLKSGNFESQGWKDSGAINAYYVSNVGRHSGSHCGYGVFVGERHTPETLAHEIGHELGLEDAQLERDEANNHLLSLNNLMFSGQHYRTALTNGQCYRCYMNPSSKLRTLPVRHSQPMPKERDCQGRIGPEKNCIDVGRMVSTLNKN